MAKAFVRTLVKLAKDVGSQAPTQLWAAGAYHL